MHSFLYLRINFDFGNRILEVLFIDSFIGQFEINIFDQTFGKCQFHRISKDCNSDSAFKIMVSLLHLHVCLYFDHKV